MTKYILDTSIFLDAEKIYYPFNQHPGFWEFLDKGLRREVLIVTKPVYEEVVRGDDCLVDWIKKRKKIVKGCYTDDIQNNYTRVVGYVNDWKSSKEKNNFLSSADPWLIALAMTNPTEYKVVTCEKKEVSPKTKFPKIPRVCKDMHCYCINLFTLIKETNPLFILDNNPFE